MNLDKLVNKYLGESIGQRSDDVLKALFDGKEKKKAFLKSSNMINKVIGKVFLSARAIDGKMGLNADAMKKVLKQKGFTDREITEIRELVIRSARKVARFIAKHHNIDPNDISAIPNNFSVYALPISGDEAEKDFNEKLKDEIRRELKKL